MLKYNPADILTPAFNLATSLQTWSFGDPLLMKEANRTWKILSHLHDCSLRIRSTHLPNMLPLDPYSVLQSPGLEEISILYIRTKILIVSSLKNALHMTLLKILVIGIQHIVIIT